MVKRPCYWADIALLLTSKAISQEAIDIMYEGSLFCVYVDQRSERFYPLTPAPPLQLLNRMQNLEIDMHVCYTQDFTASETWFEKFVGSHIKRNTCRISFPCYHCLIFCENHTPENHTPFFRACQSLVGFKRLTVALELPCADAEFQEELSEVYYSMREDFKAALEPHLGPGCSYDDGKIFSLEFHPRKYVEDVQAALLLGDDVESGAAT